MTVFLWTRTLCTAAKIMKYEKPAQEGCPEIKTKHQETGFFGTRWFIKCKYPTHTKH